MHSHHHNSLNSLQGDYRLHVAYLHIQIKLLCLTLMINQHEYQFDLQEHDNQKISITLKQQYKNNLHENKEMSNNQKQLISLIIYVFQHVQSYKMEGGMFYLYGKYLHILFRGRYEWLGQDKNKGLHGKWDIQPINLALTVSQQQFNIEGASRLNYAIKYIIDKQNSIKFDQQYKKQQGKNNSQKNISQQQNNFIIKYDKMFLCALRQSVTWKPGQVSFQMFDKNGNPTVRGTPYL